MASLRDHLRRLGIGAALLRLQQAIRFGPRIELQTFYAKKRYLRMIESAEPLDVSQGGLQVFMMLNQPRIWEGIWAIYSFRKFFGNCQVCVLNSGTLTPTSIIKLRAIFPGIQVPEITSHDEAIIRTLEEQGLHRCASWRKSFIFSRRLFDPIILSPNQEFLLLDSDILHFAPPQEVIEWSKSPKQFKYAADVNQFSLCADVEQLKALWGNEPPVYFNAGYLGVPPNAVNLNRIESQLSDKLFQEQLDSGRFSHVSEQSILAMEAGKLGASLLPEEYSICPNIVNQRTVMGHFCGGSSKRTWFHTMGLPALVKEFKLRYP